jgi:hypothetical protein
VSVGIAGGISIAPPPPTLFFDPFDGTVLDIVNRWNSPVVAGAGAAVQTNGTLTLSVGTGASSACAVSSQENFSCSGAGFLYVGGSVVFETTGQFTNSHRFLGQGTPNASFTAATPLANAYGWELDITGQLNAVTYSGNVRTIVKSLAPPRDGIPHLLLVSARADAAFFFFDDPENPVAVTGYQGAATSNLPFRYHVINHTSVPAVAPGFTVFAGGVFDGGGGYQSQFNGQALSAVRTPTVVANLNAVGIAAETTIWTPAAGRRFRLMGYQLTSGVVGGNVLLKDNTAGTTKLILPFGAAAQTLFGPPMGNGILSIAPGNVLTATGAATQTLSGYLLGTEE